MESNKEITTFIFNPDYEKLKQIQKNCEEHFKNYSHISAITLSFNCDKIRQIEKEYDKHNKNSKFIPLWNPHTDNIISESAFHKQK